ncbi:Ionotropic receptor 203, partial [Hyalella azteca]
KYPESARARFQHAVLTSRGNYSLRTVLYWPRDALTSPIRVDDGPLMPSLTELQGVPLKIAIAQVLQKNELIINRIQFIITFIKHCLINFLSTHVHYCSPITLIFLLVWQGQREVGLVTSSPKQDRLGGYLGSLIHLIADSANFSPRVVQDKSVGKRLDNGSFTGVIGRLQRREVDIGLASFTVLLRRVPAMDFTAYLRRKTTRFITKVPAYKRDPFILINVFKIETWLTMIFFTGFGFVMLAILLGPCGESEFSTEAETTYGMEYKNINRGKEIIDLPLIEGDRSAILYANEKIIGENERDFQADCQKDYGFRDELGENVQTGENFRDNEEMIYNGLPNTHRQKEERNDSYHLSQKAKILAIFRKVTHYFNWEKAGVLLKTITLQTNGIDIPATISQTAKAVYEGDDSVVALNGTVRKQCLLKSSRENFMFEFSSLGLTKNSLLSNIINSRIQQLRVTGIVAREFSRRFRPTCVVFSPSPAESGAIDLEKMEGIFLIWLGAVVATCIVFAVEVWISKRASKKIAGEKKTSVDQMEKMESDKLKDTRSQDEEEK